MDHTQSCYINPEGTPSSPTYLPLPAVEHLLSNSSATVVRCWFTGEAGDIEQNLRPCIRRHSSNYMESASIESQNSCLHWTVFLCSKDSSVHSWLISWLTPEPLTRYFHWWIMAPYYKLNEWLIDWSASAVICETISFPYPSFRRQFDQEEFFS